MTAVLWAHELAVMFWRDAGHAEPFPREVKAAVDRSSFDVTVKEKPSLSIDVVENYLAHQGIHWRCGEADRPLHACLVAIDGAGWIFLDAGDEPRERNYSLAHELAHFLRHYWQPRQRAVAALGPGIVEVLDGRRIARAGERLHGLLRGVSVGEYVHLMARGEVRVAPAVERAEHEADCLAWELLAPAGEVLARLGEKGGFDEAEALLEQAFGLPSGAARSYADHLFPEEKDSPVARNVHRMLSMHRGRPR
jgi:hypothetical protein